MIEVQVTGSFEDWHASARRLLSERVPPTGVHWTERGGPQPGLPGLLPAASAAPTPSPGAYGPVKVPRRFMSSARWVAAHRDPGRWDLLYRVLWRLVTENRSLLEIATDTDVARFEAMERQTRRDVHKMHAFVRFRRIDTEAGERYVAWHRPDHLIVRLAVPFFTARFASMRWSILTPDECAHWDDGQLQFTPGLPQSAAPSEDRVEALWQTYYASVFNPARLNLRAMRAEMPARHWATMPETRAIPALAANAARRVRRFTTVEGVSRAVVPDDRSMQSLRAAADACRACPIGARATQAVFGEGPRGARLMLVGEQPGDDEDRDGHPFVGPAGQVLDRALAAAGIDRHAVYLTNAVKHFSWEPRGKRRIHQTPRLSEVRACRPWLEAEIQQVQPAVLLTLGATAGKALLGPQFRVNAARGQVVTGTAWAPRVLSTIHPSAVLRAGSAEDADTYFKWLVDDLRQAAAVTAEDSDPPRP